MPPKKIPKKIRFYLRRREKISTGLQTIATLQLKSALAELRGNNVSPEPVHKARTSIKKVRSIIQLAAPALGRVRREHLMELLHEASSRLGPLRDSEVQVQTLDLALEAANLPAEQFSSLRSGLADIAKQRRANDWRQVPRILEYLEKALKTVPDWPLNPLGGKDLRRRIRRTYRRGRTTLDICHENADSTNFHAWRKLVKQLGYQLQITSRFWPDSAEAFLSTLDSIGEIAGQEHDLSLLIQTMKHGPRTRSSEEVIGIIEDLLPKLRQKAMSEGSLFYEAKPKIFVEPLEL